MSVLKRASLGTVVILPFSVYIHNLMFVFILCVLAALTRFVCRFTGYFNTLVLCVLAALTRFVCCFTGYFNILCVLFN